LIFQHRACTTKGCGLSVAGNNKGEEGGPMSAPAIAVRSEPEQNPFARALAVAAFIFLEGLVVFQAFSAYQDHFFTVAQMRGRGVGQGLPFIWHFGMWGDFLVISPLVAYVIGRYFVRWQLRWILASLAIGFVTAGLMSWLYTLSTIPEAHIQNHGLTAAGWGHLFYMAIVVAVFIQFLFFSGDVSVPLLRVVSLLLFAHVFFGTHMALGILKLFYPLDWYPAQPLESPFGQITLWTVGFGLAWRNLGLRRALYPVNQSVRTAEEHLRFLDYLCKIVTIWYFIPRFLWALIRGENVYALALIALVGEVYFLSRRSVWQELAIGKTIFPSDSNRIPDRLQLKDRRAITIEVTLFMLLYLALALFAHCILVASFCMLVIACIDLNTRRLINKNVREDFANPKYAPYPDEPDYTAMMKRRDTVEWFLFKLPHLWKEAGRIAGCAAAFGIANYEYFTNAQNVTSCTYLVDAFYCAIFGNAHGSYQIDRFAYIVLLATLILNELVTWWWRRERDRRLHGV
jgi:hypothetical protein